LAFSAPKIDPDMKKLKEMLSEVESSSNSTTNKPSQGNSFAKSEKELKSAKELKELENNLKLAKKKNEYYKQTPEAIEDFVNVYIGQLGDKKNYSSIIYIKKFIERNGKQNVEVDKAEFDNKVALAKETYIYNQKIDKAKEQLEALKKFQEYNQVKQLAKEITKSLNTKIVNSTVRTQGNEVKTLILKKDDIVHYERFIELSADMYGEYMTIEYDPKK
jgi:chemotaxis protein histidine kinase CheA